MVKSDWTIAGGVDGSRVYDEVVTSSYAGAAAVSK